jgi:hypothetical protein
MTVERVVEPEGRRDGECGDVLAQPFVQQGCLRIEVQADSGQAVIERPFLRLRRGWSGGGPADQRSA